MFSVEGGLPPLFILGSRDTTHAMMWLSLTRCVGEAASRQSHTEKERDGENPAGVVLLLSFVSSCHYLSDSYTHNSFLEIE